MAAQPPQSLFGPGDHGSDVEVGVRGQRVLDVAGVDPGLDDEECGNRAARHQASFTYLATVAAFAWLGFVGFAPMTGRRTK